MSNGQMTGHISVFAIEIALTVVSIIVSLAAPRLGSKWFRKLEIAFGPLAKRRGLSVLVVGISAILVRAYTAAFTPIPEPLVHDEYSYLLAGDTFASGRLTNPTHPMWKHFETFHVIHKPTYMSKYPPAQGLALAAGQVVAGFPMFGVWLSAALMCSAICWMLQAWLPPGWALLGGFLAMMRLSTFSYWGTSYWGGAVPAIGGALVLGALPRIIRRQQVSDTLLLGLGLAILANSRPYEGVLLSLPVFGALAMWLWGKNRPPAGRILQRVILPFSCFMTLVLGGMIYYNWRVTGKALTWPYMMYEAQYSQAPAFLWQSPKPMPAYRHRVMYDMNQWIVEIYTNGRSIAGMLTHLPERIWRFWIFFLGPPLTVVLVSSWCQLRDQRMRLLLLTIMFSVCGLAITSAGYIPHYTAPVTPAMYALILQGLRRLRALREQVGIVGLGLVRTIITVCVITFGLRLAAKPIGLSVENGPLSWAASPDNSIRRSMVQTLTSEPGLHIVIVRYSDTHDIHYDWIYNRADIDNSAVVWAREMKLSDNEELLRYFSNRTAWLLEADISPPRLSAYPRTTPFSPRQ